MGVWVSGGGGGGQRQGCFCMKSATVINGEMDCTCFQMDVKTQ